MAKLMRIQISGIRSFGPYDEHTQSVKFGSPVTLILGQNGSGKTTIIESIKYACTAELPAGSSNGQGFVNDPKMCGTSSCTGQVKLKFLDPKAHEITVSRVVEVCQTASSMTFKTKSAAIRKVSPSGEDVSVTNRCTDVTAECCQLMNVSSAVLNNVIFCHQENSCWPLDEGKKLKERFDEIFDAQKYNKCSDLFRNEIKSKKSKIDSLKNELAYRRDKKVDVERQIRQLQEKEEKCNSFETMISAKKGEVEPLKQRINEIFDLEQVLGDLQNKLTAKEATIKQIVEEQASMKRNLAFEFEGTDEELQEKIQYFENDRQKEQNLIQELEIRKTEIENKTRVISNEIQEAQAQLGQLNQEKRQYETKCSTRRLVLEQARNKMDLSELSQFEDNEGARTALYELKTELENQEMCLCSFLSQEEAEQKTLQTKVDKARERTVRMEQNIASKRNEVDDCDSKIKELFCQLRTMNASQLFFEKTTKKIDDIDKTICTLNNSVKEQEQVQKIESFRNEIRNKESALEVLESEYRSLSHNDITDSKIESERHNIMDKQKEIDRIENEHSASFRHLFEGDIPSSNVKDSVQTKQRNADLNLKTLNDRVSKKQQEVTTLEVQLSHQTENLKACEKDLRLNKNKISQVCNGRNFFDLLKTTTEKKERLQTDKGQYSSVKIIYGQYIKKFEELAPCCPVCDTDFSNKGGAVQKIIANLKSKVDRVPQELIRVENELMKEEALFSKLQQLKLVNDDIEQVSKEKLPNLKQEIRETEQKLNNSKTELKELQSQLQEPLKIVEISKNIISDASYLDQCRSDIEKSCKTVEDLKLRLVQVGSNKSKQEVEAEIDCLKSEIVELRGKIESHTKKISNHKDRIQQLLQERNGYVDTQIKARDDMQRRPLVEAQQAELGERIKTLKQEIKAIELDLQAKRADLETAIQNKDSAAKRYKHTIQEQRDKIRSYSEIIQEVDNIQKEVDQYLNNDVDRKLTAAEDKLQQFKKKEAALDETKVKIINAISKKREDLAKDELRFRTFQSNVVLRQKKELAQTINLEITDLKRKIGGYNYRTVYEEKSQLQQRRELLEKEINNLSGEKTGIMTSIEELSQELSRPENKKAYANYMAKFYELKIAERSQNDLQIYVNALEKAVLDFHKSKMVQINRTIRELWRNTYRGNDVDYIEIKSEHGKSTANKRSYNYKVVQVKKGVELDMRGRCSAGQKILACLIIRMALAETMSSNCGILALDEPTTNLDRANIYSLCDTLTRIINARQSEKTFQLIVITHDEEFLNALTRVQGVSDYYRVKRDNNGFSVIEREDVAN